MSRVSEMDNGLKKVKNEHGGLSREKMKVYLLAEIALSLARIVDVLEGEEEEQS